MVAELKVYWWKHPDSIKGNFGDETTPEIIERIWGIKCEWAPIEECELVSTGSIIEKVARENKKGHKINVWGSGFMHSGRRPFTNKDFYFFAVRGKLTKRRLLFKNPWLATGDPGILASRVYPASKERTHLIGIIPHYADFNNASVSALSKRSDVKIINPLQRPADIVKEITSCKIIFSSSLHGLIFADSFEVPNYWVQLSNNVHGGSYKFYDYFSSIGRKRTVVDIKQVANQKTVQNLITDYMPIKDLIHKQNALINAFPYQKPGLK